LSNLGDREKAFTLIEVLVSASLLTIIATSFFYIFKTSAGFQKKAEQKLEAAYSMQAKMEELRGLSYADLLLQNGKDGVKILPIDSDLVEVRVGQIYTMRAK